MKKCLKCNSEKELSEFGNLKTNKDGLNTYCKICHRERINKYRGTEEFKNKRKEDYYNNREFYLNEKKIYFINNKEKIKEKDKKYYDENREIILLKKKEYRDLDENKEHMKEYLLEYRSNKDNRDVARSYNQEYQYNRNRTDKLFKLSNNIRSLIGNSLKSKGYLKESRKSVDILGCSIDEFRLHLESKFEEWMSWDNKGLYNGEINYGWDIDHIIPTSSAKTEEEVLLLNHYTNLQPLCSKINRDVKKANINYSIESLPASFEEIR